MEQSDVFKVPIIGVNEAEEHPPDNTEQESRNSKQKEGTSKELPKKSQTVVPLPYKEPEWGGVPPSSFYFEVIKNGTLISNTEIKSSCFVFGRLQVCDVIFEHPSVSRYHAIVQYCKGDETHPKGFYLYDLGSTHGTFLNKETVKPNIYYKLKVGYVLKFGGSSRLHIFQGPEEEEIDNKGASKSAKPTVQEGCNWGMGEDADQEDARGINPFAITTEHEELYLVDPKKALRSWFEREGYEVEYQVEEKGQRTFSCSVKLPVDTPTGDFLTVEASVSGKKKEAVVACAREACRTLDRLGLLRQSHHEGRQKKKKKWEENDFYDSDEDTFYDRTGEIEKRREMRMRLAKKVEADNFQTLEAKLETVSREIDEINQKLESYSASEGQAAVDDSKDSLESYMSNLASGPSDKFEKRRLKLKLNDLEKEKSRFQKMLNIARPTKLPPIAKHTGMIGRKLKSKLQLSVNQLPKPVQSDKDVVEEDSDSEHDSEGAVNSNSKTVIDQNDPSTIKHDEETIEEENDESKNPNYDKSENLEIDAEKTKQYGLQFVQKPNFGTKRKTDAHEVGSKTKSIEGESNKALDTLTVCEENKKVSTQMNSDSKKYKSLEKTTKNNAKKQKADVDVYETDKNEYCTWTPPVNQTGDGKTHLNAKYGY